MELETTAAGGGAAFRKWLPFDAVESVDVAGLETAVWWGSIATIGSL